MPNAQRAQRVCPRNNSKLCNLLLTDAEYRDRWFHVQDQLAALQRAKDAEQASVDAEAANREAELNAMRANAPKLSDGRAIFRKRDGSWVDENGRPVSSTDAAVAVQRWRNER